MGKFSKNELIYFIAFVLLQFITLCGISRIITIEENVNRILTLLLILMLIFKILVSKYKLKELIVVVIVSVIAFLATYLTNNNMFLFDALAIFALKDINIKKVLKIDIIFKIFFLVLHVLIYGITCIFDYSSIIDTLIYSASGDIRHSFFFSHPNSVNGVAVCLAIDLILLYPKNKKVIFLCCLFLLFFSIFSGSRTSLLIFLIFMTLYYLVRKDKIASILEKVNTLLILLFSFISYFIVTLENFWGNPFIVSINTLLSGRLHLGKRAFEKYGLNLLPKTINDGIIDNTIAVDNFYIRCFVEYGVIILLILFLLYLICRKRNKNKDDIVIMTVFSIFLFSELYPFNIGRSIIFLLIGNIWINNKKQEVCS